MKHKFIGVFTTDGSKWCEIHDKFELVKTVKTHKSKMTNKQIQKMKIENIYVAHGNITHPMGAKCKFCDKLKKESEPVIEMLNQALKMQRLSYVKKVESLKEHEGFIVITKKQLLQLLELEHKIE